MQVMEIKRLLLSPKVSETPRDILTLSLTGSLLKVYTLSGVAKTFQPQQLEQEMSIISSQLIDDLQREPIFKGLRVPEIDYCLLSGIKGKLDVKTFGMNYQTFYKWLLCYIESDTREQAYNSLRSDNEAKQLTASCELTLTEQRQIMIDGINSAYSEYLRLSRNGVSAYAPKKAPFDSFISKVNDNRDSFLVREGLKSNNTPLNAFFEQCKKEGKTKIL
jgi:hypothetical protein